MSISICILNYNSWEDTNECLESLSKQTIDDFQVVVVDNASTNNSVEMIEENCNKLQLVCDTLGKGASVSNKAKVYILKSDKNRGFSAGNNIGLNFSKQNLAVTHILFLNNDTVVPVDFVENIQKEYVSIQKTNKEKVALGCVEYNYYTREQSHTGFHYLNILFGWSFSYPIFPYFKYICGACLLVGIDAPFLDDSYFLYFDDVKYAKTLQETGYQLYSTDKTCYFHKVSTTTNKLGLQKAKYYFESLWRFYREYYPLFVKFIYVVRYCHAIVTNKKEIADIIKTTYRRYNK